MVAHIIIGYRARKRRERIGCTIQWILYDTEVYDIDFNVNCLLSNCWEWRIMIHKTGWARSGVELVGGEGFGGGRVIED